MLIRRRLQHASSGSFDTSETESTSKVVLHLLFSPCKYIASHARNVLTDVLRNNESKDHFTYLLDFLTAIAVQDYTVAPDNAQITQRLISFTCYSAIAEFQSQIIHKGGVKMLLTIVKRHLYSNKSSISHHPCNISIGRTEICCFRDHQSKEETDSLLLYSLQALSQLLPLAMHQHRKTSGEDNASQSDQFEEYNRETYVGIFLQILNRACSCEVKWYASYCLSFFGFYGFPSRLGGRMTRALNEKEYTNLQLALSDRQYVGVHIVVLMVRCPQVLPHEICSRINKTSDDSSGVFLQHEMISSQEAHLSDHICRRTLDKLLEYGYTGFCEVDDDIVKPMKVIAKKCGLNSLLFLLQRKQPAWRTPLPRFDLAAALSPPGHMFSDVILEAEETVTSWNCSVCILSMPHIYAHKVILSSGCGYIQALFQSGMKESSQEVIEVPVSWKALVKLVSWFYSGELPRLNYTCTWFNMDKETQFDELLVYVELSWLAEFWCLDEVREESIDVVLSCVRLNQNFPVRIIQIAMNLNQWQIVEASIHQLAPLFPKLSNSNELEELDDVAEMLREGYVHHSQENHDYDW